MTLAIQTAIVMVVLLVIMLAMGVSISISVGLSSAVAMLCMLPAQVSFVTSAQRLFAGANSFSLIAIPFFILAGNLMNNGGIAERLVNVAKAIAGRMPGALAQTNIIANMLFGAISGSGAAAAAAMGGTIGPGLQVSLDALVSRTAMLPRVELQMPQTVLGRNTVEQIQAGVVAGYVGNMEYLIRQVMEEMDCEGIKVIATGGLSRMIAQQTDKINIVDPMLTMDGLRMIFDANRDAKPIEVKND